MPLKFGTGGPFKTFALWMVVVVGLACVGFYIGSWLVPLTLAIARDGWTGISQIRIAHGTPQLPDWLPPNTVERALAILAYGVAIFWPGAFLARQGERLYGYLVVKKLRWLTQEQVDEARKQEKQYF